MSSADAIVARSAATLVPPKQIRCGEQVVHAVLFIAAASSRATALGEYAAPRAAAFLKPFLEILAAIPTVVLGYFALTFVTPFLRDQVGLQDAIFNALSASLVLGVMLLPPIATLSEDAMAAVL